MMDIHPEYTSVLPERKPRLIFPVLLWLGIIGLLIGGGFMLTGCAQTTFTGLCALKPIGKNEHGHTVVATYCEAS
jgi:hypothetical protein